MECILPLCVIYLNKHCNKETLNPEQKSKSKLFQPPTCCTENSQKMGLLMWLSLIFHTLTILNFFLKYLKNNVRFGTNEKQCIFLQVCNAWITQKVFSQRRELHSQYLHDFSRYTMKDKCHLKRFCQQWLNIFKQAEHSLRIEHQFHSLALFEIFPRKDMFCNISKNSFDVVAILSMRSDNTILALKLYGA